jgi:hypothetical protein
MGNRARYEQFRVEIRCRKCGHTGSALWEDGAMGSTLISLEGFYERLASKPPHAIQVVCNACGEVQPA